MIVTLNLETNSCVVTREPNDKRLSRPGWTGTDADSTFWYHVAKTLQKQGYDVIRKRMSKDGHMYGSDSTQYVRSRDKKKGFMIYDGDYALRFAFEDFNKGAPVKLLCSTY